MDDSMNGTRNPCFRVGYVTFERRLCRQSAIGSGINEKS